jgi:hypothetical protein
MLPLAALALAGVLLIVVITRDGPGASGDSAYYVMGAQNLIAGNGFSRTSGGGEVKPITGFPPVFSAVLAVLGSMGGDLFQIGRYLDAVLFGLNIALAAGLVFRYSRSLWPTMLAGLALLAADQLVTWHAWIMSEPLYIALMLVGFYLTLDYLERARWTILVGLAVCLSAATLTRYVGLALVASSTLSILLLSKTPIRRRVTDCILLGVISLGPVFLWLRRNVDVAGTGVNRTFSFHPMSPELVKGFVSAASEWLVPRSTGLPGVVRAGIAAILAAGILALFVRTSLQARARMDRDRWRERVVLPMVLFFYLVFHVTVLYVNSTFLDAATTLSAPPRYLLPAFVTGVALFAGLISRMLQLSGVRWLRWAVGGSIVALIGLYAWPTVQMVRNPIPEIGYTGLRYTMPGVVNWLSQVSPGEPIISNNPEMVYILSGRSAYMRPILFDVYQLKYREDYEQQLADAQAKLDQGGVLILFGPLDDEEKNVLGALRVAPAETFEGATAYKASP